MDNLLPQAISLLQDDWVIYALPIFFTALLKSGLWHGGNPLPYSNAEIFSRPWASCY